MNTRLLLSKQEAKRLAHPTAIWIAHKKTSDHMFNNCDLKDKMKSGKQHFQMVAYHSSATDIYPSPGIDDRQI